MPVRPAVALAAATVTAVTIAAVWVAASGGVTAHGRATDDLQRRVDRDGWEHISVPNHHEGGGTTTYWWPPCEPGERVEMDVTAVHGSDIMGEPDHTTADQTTRDCPTLATTIELPARTLHVDPPLLTLGAREHVLPEDVDDRYDRTIELTDTYDDHTYLLEASTQLEGACTADGGWFAYRLGPTLEISPRACAGDPQTVPDDALAAAGGTLDDVTLDDEQLSAVAEQLGRAGWDRNDGSNVTVWEGPCLPEGPPGDGQATRVSVGDDGDACVGSTSCEIADAGTP